MFPVLGLTRDSRGMMYFQQTLKKAHGICPVMSLIMLEKRSPPGGRSKVRR